eukprot:8287039-Alexandrium_andersonii.AAC.1
MFLARFKTEAPKFGRGRMFFSSTRFRTWMETKSGQGIKWVCKMMEKDIYFKHAQTLEGGSKTLPEAVQQWSAWEATNDPNVTKDSRGRNGSLRVA